MQPLMRYCILISLHYLLMSHLWDATNKWVDSIIYESQVKALLFSVMKGLLCRQAD